MSRKQELEKVKKIIKERFDDGDCGLFNTKNLVGDTMINIFEGKYFSLDICIHWMYFEVFGTTKKEFKELEEFYTNLRRW